MDNPIAAAVVGDLALLESYFGEDGRLRPIHALPLPVGFARSAAYVDLLLLAAGAAMLMGAREVRAWHVLAVCPWMLGPSWVGEPMQTRMLRLRVASTVVFFAACNRYSVAGS